MFYSHEILTNRQHGVATVWLVATLGSKTNLKKVTRKAILDVDIPKACGTIQDPSAPMALRLQGNLLYGVSRVYSQQCGYVLADTQNFRDKMKGVVMVMKEFAIDSDVGRAGLYQLNLPDDPAFLPDFDMNIDLSMFDDSADTSRQPGSMAPPSFLSIHPSEAKEAVEGPDDIFRSAETPIGGEFGGFGFGEDASSAHNTTSRVGRGSAFEDTGMIEDPGFEFDAEGNLVAVPPMSGKERVGPSATGPVRNLRSDLAIVVQVGQENETEVQETKLHQDIASDNAPFSFGYDDLPLPEALPFSSARRLFATPAEQVPRSPSALPNEEASSAAEAPQHKFRVPKLLQADYPQELANSDLAYWNTNYLANMANAAKIKRQHKAVILAKKNAAFWVLGQGIAGVGISLGDGRVPNPLAIFSGQALLAALTGREISLARLKRTRTMSDAPDKEGELRRVRARGDEEQQGRGDGDDNNMKGLPLRDDDGLLFPGEEMDIEIGRHAPESLHGEHSSQWPWNASTSRHGSVRAFGSGFLGGISSSVGGRGTGTEFGPTSALPGRLGSRVTSASPLLGRSSKMARYSSLDLPEQGKLTGGSGGVDVSDNGDIQLRGDNLVDDPEFQLCGPAAMVEAQTAAQSRWVAAALDREAHSFLAFLRAEIDANIIAAERTRGQLEDKHAGKVTFEGLLPQGQHSKVVAAQGLLHVLSLATKGLIEVKQERAFEGIEICVVTIRRVDNDGGEEMDI